jgi:hypothetical protein
MRRYDAADYSDLSSWLSKRGMPLSQKMDLPEVGYIEPDVACGFLIQTDTKTAIIDFVISNPEASRRERNSALNCILRELIKHARWLHYKRINASIQVSVSKELAKSVGFRELGEHSEFMKEL